MADQQYFDLCKRILETGVGKDDRTGTGTLSVFGHQMRFDLEKGFPLLTTKRVPFRLVALELLWFLKGMTNAKWLQEQNCRIWDEWTDPDGELGRIYGAQWRGWRTGKIDNDEWEKDMVYKQKTVDQITNVIEGIKNNPNGRRHIVNAWNVGELDEMNLPPCHIMFQFYVANGKLSCQLYQRSVDTFLGLPFNIASYALLTHMIARECGLGVGEFIHTSGDAHIYANHIEQIKMQTEREPRQLPELWLDPKINKVLDFELEHLAVNGYDPHPTIKGKVAI